MQESGTGKVSRKRKALLLPDKHFYKNKEKTNLMTKVTATQSLNLTFTVMYRHSGTAHPLCETFLYRRRGF